MSSTLRDSELRRSIAVGVAAKVSSAGARFLTVGLSLRILGPELYGLWVSAGSLVSWLALSDLGLSAGLISAVSRARGSDDHLLAKRLISSAYGLFAAIAAAVLILSIGFSHTSLPIDLLGVAQNLSLVPVARALLLILSVVFAVSLLVNVVTSVSTALQRPYLSSLASMAGNCAVIVFLGILALLRDRSLFHFVIAATAPPIAANALLTVLVFGRWHREYCPSLTDISSRYLRAISSPSFYVVIGQVGDLAIHYSANLIIASASGPGAVPSYSVPYSLFMLAQTTSSTLLGPLWPFYSEANQRGDREWIIRTFRRSSARVLGVMLLFVIGIVLLGRPVIRLWAGAGAVPTWSLLLWMGLNFQLWMVSSTVWMLAYGLSCFRARAAVSVLNGTLFIAGSYLLLPALGLLALPVVGSVVMLVDSGIGLLLLRSVFFLPSRCR